MKSPELKAKVGIHFEPELKNGNMLLAIINTDLLDWDSKASHPWVAVFTIQYDGTSSNGMPGAATIN